jgi:hypothetical protein
MLPKTDLLPRDVNMADVLSIFLVSQSSLSTLNQSFQPVFTKEVVQRPVHMSLTTHAYFPERKKRGVYKKKENHQPKITKPNNMAPYIYNFIWLLIWLTDL